MYFSKFVELYLYMGFLKYYIGYSEIKVTYKNADHESSSSAVFCSLGGVCWGQ